MNECLDARASHWHVPRLVVGLKPAHILYVRPKRDGRFNTHKDAGQHPSRTSGRKKLPPPPRSLSQAAAHISPVVSPAVLAGGYGGRDR